MNILLTAIGKRIQLISFLQKTFYIVGVDSSFMNPAKNFVDVFLEVPTCTNKQYINKLLQISKDNKIDVIIPLYEKEFETLNVSRKDFDKLGVFLLLSDSRVVNICNDKLSTYQFFLEYGIKTPKLWNMSDIVTRDNKKYIIKPKDGMGSQGVYIARDIDELKFFSKYISNSIIQEYIEGTEYTIDLFCDNDGRVASCVPRQRLQVRSGEVSKSVTRNHPKIIEQTIYICEKLGGIGPLTLQCIEDKDGEIYWIEINPRFGGGVPLTMKAGIDYGKMIKEWTKGKPIESQMGKFQPNLYMLRYDEAVFVDESNL